MSSGNSNQSLGDWSSNVDARTDGKRKPVVKYIGACIGNVCNKTDEIANFMCQINIVNNHYFITDDLTGILFLSHLEKHILLKTCKNVLL